MSTGDLGMTISTGTQSCVVGDWDYWTSPNYRYWIYPSYPVVYGVDNDKTSRAFSLAKRLVDDGLVSINKDSPLSEFIKLVESLEKHV